MKTNTKGATTMKKSLTARRINRLLKSGTKLFFTDADYQTRTITRAKTIGGLEYVLTVYGEWTQVDFSGLEQQQ
jgi:hypothetical protein|tara:strand:+ start:509 stop:730 length:222 start_codon:yes stop_codon:yes gene_type:complete